MDIRLQLITTCMIINNDDADDDADDDGDDDDDGDGDGG